MFFIYDLKLISVSELPSISNWILEGLSKLLSKKKISESEAISQQLEEYKKQSDSVRIFMDELEYSPCSDRTFGDRL